MNLILILFAFALYFYRLRHIGEWPYLTREQVIALIIESTFGEQMASAVDAMIMRGDL